MSAPVGRMVAMTLSSEMRWRLSWRAWSPGSFVILATSRRNAVSAHPASIPATWSRGRRNGLQLRQPQERLGLHGWAGAER